MIGIYKITNTINGKCYIGQSVNIEKRWIVHKRVYNNPNAHEYDYHIYRAFRKYGIEQFKFEVIEECSIADLNQREIYWINYYNSYKDGYNQTSGGSKPHPVKITPDKLEQIDLLLSKTDLSIQEIADEFNVSYEMIQGINTGRYWYRENIKYPIGDFPIGIRRSKDNQEHFHTNQEKYCCDCGKQISKDAVRCWDCYVKSLVQQKLTKNELLKLLQNYSMEAIGRMYHVSGKVIRKWCDKYNIPHLKKDVQQYIIANNIEID